MYAAVRIIPPFGLIQAADHLINRDYTQLTDIPK
jgi:hypothetical protein